MIPSYVFARADRDHRGDRPALRELLTLAKTPIKRHRSFSVVILDGRIPIVSDAALAPMRDAEAKGISIRDRAKAKARFKGKPPIWNEGAGVTLVDPGFQAFEGLPGVVQSTRGKGKWVLVLFQSALGQVEVEVSAWQLDAVQVDGAASEQGKAVRTA